jgi:bifunctional UDP-N-acetylglucosamine pyrophosphorylase/glucosamine-1-phosphate N-acetyltransferase
MGSERALAVVVLAAGQGTRMKSDLAKVLHPVAGRPMLTYVLDAAQELAPDELWVVLGKDAARVREAFVGAVDFVEQPEQGGTGHAVLCAREGLRDFEGEVLVLCGDTPLLRSESLFALRHAKSERKADLMILSASCDLPGRIVRDETGRVARIVETTDASPEELAISEGNTGVLLVDSDLLWEALDQIDDRNAQNELYLTDIVGIAVARGRPVDALVLSDPHEALGVNTRAELALAAAIQRRRNAERWMAEGVTLIDPDATYLDTEVCIGQDTLIEPGCVIQGQTRIGAHCHIKAHTAIEDAELGDKVVVGPSAHLRPGTRLATGVRVGNFVEIKNSELGVGAKADHLSYIGDADVGDGASFGCGSVVVNYDGIEKHRTTVDAGAFVGCNANLVAPLRIEARAFVAAGSTVTRDVPAGALAVARARQRNLEGWRDKRDAKTKVERTKVERATLEKD